MSEESLTIEERVELQLETEIQAAWLGLINQEAGRLILWSILNKCGNFAFPHYGDTKDAVYRGRQQVGQELLDDFVFHRGMSYYTDMLLEAEERDNRLRAASELTQDADQQDE